MSQTSPVSIASRRPHTPSKKLLLVLLVLPLLQLQHERGWGLPAIKQGSWLLTPGWLHALPLLLLELEGLLWGTLGLPPSKCPSTGLLLWHLRHGTRV